MLRLIKNRNNISNFLRQRSASSAKTAAYLLEDDYKIINLISHADGYRILKDIRTSPAHWEDEKKKVMGMIRQFSLPTFFITLSTSETRFFFIFLFYFIGFHLLNGRKL